MAQICRQLSSRKPAVRPLPSAVSVGQRAAVPRRAAVQTRATLKAIIFDCEGAILDSDELSRRAFNAAFEHFDVQGGDEGVVSWSREGYAQLQNSAGGREQEMRWYFKRGGWPTSKVLDGRRPADEQERAALVEALEGYISQERERMISSGDIGPRPGVLRLMDEARAAGLAVSVRSAAATTSGAEQLLGSLLGEARAGALQCVVAGEDAGLGRPDAEVFKAAASRMGVEPAECLAVEGGSSGLQAAMSAGMRGVVTYTPSTQWQEFPGAERIVSDLDSGEVTVRELLQRRIVQDDRINMTVTDAGVFWSKGGAL